MKKIWEKIKKYNPSYKICLLYFFVPIYLCAIVDMSRENDIWFLLNHGKYVIEHGFPVIEPFSMHHGFSFVMQQWLSAVIFYLTYSVLGKYGLLLVVNIINLLILYFTYKLCILLTDNRKRLSIILTCITDVLLLTSFIIPRPQIFTYLLLIITLYIMEKFIRFKDTKLIYFLPLISLLQINLHASMWFMIFLFMLPYIVSLFINKLKDKNDNRIFKLLIIMVLMFLVGFINPYTTKNMFYVFTSYGNMYINNSVIEMFPPIKLLDSKALNIYTFLHYLTVLGIISIYIVNKKAKLNLANMLLLLGVLILATTSIRSYPLLVIGAVPFLGYNLKFLFPNQKEIKYSIKDFFNRQYILVLIIFVTFLIGTLFIKKVSFTNELKPGIDYLEKKHDLKSIVLYTNYNNGSYAEYRGLKPYIDTRAEVFLKSNNHKEDIMMEYYFIQNGLLDYDKFINKYNFTHMIISKNDPILLNVSKDKRYRIIYKGKGYKIYERV